MNVRDPLWSKATATKQQMKSETGTQKSFLFNEPVEMVHTDAERSATNVSQWQVLALRG
jgi:hypothetical protein